MVKLFKNLSWKISLIAARFCLLSSRRHYRLFLPLFTSQDGRLNLLLKMTAGIAFSKGLKFRLPTIRLINPGIAGVIKHRRDDILLNVYRILGQATRDGNFILIYSEVLEKYNEVELAVIIAHELGHIIDFQTKRIGHPLFDNIRHLDQEMFAHAIAAYIYSKLVVMVVYKTVNIPINELRFCRINLDC